MTTSYGIYATTSAILWTLTILTISTVLILFFKKKTDAPGIKIAIHLSTAFFITALIGSIGACYKRLCAAIRNFYSNGCHENNCYPMESAMEIVAGAFIVFSYVLILYIFISRLKNAFDNTPHAYPRCFYICICCEIAIFTIFAIVGGVVSDNAVIRGSTLFVFILNGILLTILFTHSLKKVIHSKENRKSVRDTMVKFVVLVSLTMATSLMVCIALILHEIFGGNSLNGLDMIIAPIDTLTNTLFIYLQFDDANYKLCGKYHGFVEHLFKKDDNLENDVEVQIETNSTSKAAPNQQDTTGSQTNASSI
eukprot:62226_1